MDIRAKSLKPQCDFNKPQCDFNKPRCGFNKSHCGFKLFPHYLVTFLMLTGILQVKLFCLADERTDFLTYLAVDLTLLLCPCICCVRLVYLLAIESCEGGTVG